jgi:hypothetical protein
MCWGAGRNTGRPAEEIQPVLKDLVQRKLMLEIDGRISASR